MKVGIFTFPNSASYGATLQMYALCRAVERLGHEADAIHYQNMFMKKELHCKSTAESDSKYLFKRKLKRVLHGKQYRNFKKFEKKSVSLYPKKLLTNESRLPFVGVQYDAIVCGSDQVWNPRITGGDMTYFLDFVPENVKKVSYAGFEDHIGYEVSKKQCTGFGGMISFELDSVDTAMRLLSGVKMILFAESLGGTETLITYPLTQTHESIPADIREKLGINESFIRISIGIEDVTDIIADLEQALG